MDFRKLENHHTTLCNKKLSFAIEKSHNFKHQFYVITKNLSCMYVSLFNLFK